MENRSIFLMVSYHAAAIKCQTSLKNVYLQSKHVRIFFGSVRKMFGNVQLTFRQYSENFRNYLKNLGKINSNFVIKVVGIINNNKQIIHACLEIWHFSSRVEADMYYLLFYSLVNPHGSGFLHARFSKFSDCSHSPEI